MLDEIPAEEFASSDLEPHWEDEYTRHAAQAEAEPEARVNLGAQTLNEMRVALGFEPYAFSIRKAKAINNHKPSPDMAVPRTPDVRLEIIKAIQALVAQDDDERLRQRRAAIASIRREIEDIARDVRKLQREWPSLILKEMRGALCLEP